MLGLVKRVANYTQVVAPTVLSSISCLVFYRAPTGKIHVFAGGKGAVYIAQERDSFTYTHSLTNPGNVFDLNLDTCGSKSATGPVSETEVLRVDYGSVASRIVYIKGGADTSVYLRFYYSVDGTNWTLFRTIYPGSTVESVFVLNLRYLRATYENTGSTTYTARIYEVWAVSPANCYVIAPTLESGVQKLSLSLPRYFVFAIPDPVVSCAVYEENVPTSIQEVLIE